MTSRVKTKTDCIKYHSRKIQLGTEQKSVFQTSGKTQAVQNCHVPCIFYGRYENTIEGFYVVSDPTLLAKLCCPSHVTVVFKKKSLTAGCSYADHLENQLISDSISSSTRFGSFFLTLIRKNIVDQHKNNWSQDSK